MGEKHIDLRGLFLAVITGAWLAGILFASWLAIPPLALALMAGAALLFVILLWQDKRGRLYMLLLLMLLLGAWRYTLARPLNDQQAVSRFIGPAKLELRGMVSDEPKLAGRSRVLLVTISGLSFDGGNSWRTVDGQIEAQTLGTEIEDPYGANYGDSIELRGKLQAPPPQGPPDVFASMAFPLISVTGASGNPIIAALYHLRAALATIIAQALPQPAAALLIAILLSLRTPALKPLIPAFNVTGTAHLIAPSGFKVTILAGMIVSSTRWLYEKRGASTLAGPLLPAQKRRGQRRRWLGASLVMASIAAYTILSGSGPAAMRAGIMGTLLVVAPRLERTYNFYTAMALVAFLLSLSDPFVLWDVGFQLSFLGTLGIILLTPSFQRLLQPVERLPFGLGHHLAEIIAVTLAAQTATLPIFAVAFHQVSFIAPIANLLVVPLLGLSIALGFIVGAAGLLFMPLGIVCGWVAWPLLWYVIAAVTWCANLHWAYMSTNGMSIDAGLCWGYYGLLGFCILLLQRRWPAQQPHQAHSPQFRLPKHTRRFVLAGAALFIVLATGASALAAPAGNLAVTFLSVGPTDQEPQGEAILISTRDGKTALIDGGMDAVSLSQALDTRLPSWQRSLDMVLLTTPRKDHLAGIQDIVSRFQVGEVVDAGELHPNTSYTLWRHTIAERGLPYTQARQGATITLGAQVTLQVLWPASPLHKSSSEEYDNTLVLRLVAPGLRLLLLGTTAMSRYALSGLLTAIAPDYLQADIVQVVGEVGKSFPAELSAVLQAAHPALLVITPAALSAHQRQAHLSSTIALTRQLSDAVTDQVVQTSQAGTLEITSDNHTWDLQQPVSPGV
ncbi:MAG: ComEC/Rec2 family competence protein [Chloroflexota bacterium]|nr:ComEC/Rec2 family competence protein [Chloroflexota bacterium]